MIEWIKRISIFLIAGFVLFFIFTRPEQAADVVRSIFTALHAMVEGVMTFFASLAS